MSELLHYLGARLDAAALAELGALEPHLGRVAAPQQEEQGFRRRDDLDAEALVVLAEDQRFRAVFDTPHLVRPARRVRAQRVEVAVAAPRHARVDRVEAVKGLPLPEHAAVVRGLARARGKDQLGVDASAEPLECRSVHWL